MDKSQKTGGKMYAVIFDIDTNSLSVKFCQLRKRCANVKIKENNDLMPAVKVVL